MLRDVLTGWRRTARPAVPQTLIGRFVPSADVSECHGIRIDAPADVVMQAARALDMSSLPAVGTLFRLRASLLGGAAPRRSRAATGLVAETEALGWACLSERPGLEYVAGAAAQPWLAHTVFRPIAPGDFVAWSDPGYVKIAWSLEVEPLSPESTLFRTQTRVVATDAASRRRFLRYWLLVGPGVVLIRHLMLRSLKRDAERLSRIPAPPERSVITLNPKVPSHDLARGFIPGRPT